MCVAFEQMLNVTTIQELLHYRNQLSKPNLIDNSHDKLNFGAGNTVRLTILLV